MQLSTIEKRVHHLGLKSENHETRLDAHDVALKALGVELAWMKKLLFVGVGVGIGLSPDAIVAVVQLISGG